ncbi:MULTISPECIES: hypothetical protein [unclassified Bradyrhizobium]|uniref:hypothetical protein n=1 Tax=unclassified Bradyrhizobium TaxID=2631580 RepID=UPI0028E3F8EF|nr:MULTISPECIES: hypothetical protein [unclassified Bradyrhizobium]
MITEEDFDGVADVSPEMAFVRLERKFRAAYEKNIEGNDNSGVWDHLTIEYMNHVVAAARALNIELFDFWAIPTQKNTYETYQNFRHEVDNYTVQIQIRHIRSGPKNSVALDTDEKKFLRAYADAIKDVIDRSSLVPAKKDRLYDKINAFIKELDSERMPLQKFHDVILSLATTGAEAADKLEPAWKWVRLAAELLGARQETEQKKLPPPPKKIEAPKRQIEALKKARQEMDDDIPF